MEPYFGQLFKEIEASERTLEQVFALVKKGTSITVDVIEKKGGTKQELATLLLRFTGQIQKNISLMKRTFDELDQTREKARIRDDEIIEIQKELIDCRENQKIEFTQAIKEQVKTYSDVVKDQLAEYTDTMNSKVETEQQEPSAVADKAHGKAINWTKIDFKTPLKAVVKEINYEQRIKEERDRSIVIFGKPGSMSIEEVLEEITDEGEYEKAYYFKDKKSAVKVTLKDRATALEALRNSHQLRDSDDYEGIYVTKARSKEENDKHKKLVQQLKRKIEEEPHTHWVIYRDKVVPGKPTHVRKCIQTVLNTNRSKPVQVRTERIRADSV